jgi:hypothetical protein
MLRSTFAREIAAAAAFAGFLCVAPAPAQEVSFAGKKIDMYIGSSPGGGTDLSSRLIGDFVVKYLPGKPAIVYRNIPGGQGVKALNYFARDVKPDGLGFAGGSQGHFDPAGGRQSAIEYGPLTFKPGAKPVVVPAVAGASTGPQMALWGKEYLGWNVKFVIGYSGTPAMILAAMNGEADSMASSSSSQLKPLLDNPAFAPFTQLGDLNDSGKFVPRVAFPNVKVFADIIAPKLAKNDGEILLAWLQTQYIDKWFALPPATPDAIVETYKRAFDQAVKDPEFIKQAALQFGEDFGTTSAQNMTGLVHGMVKNAERVDKHMRAMRLKHGLPEE